MEMQPWFETNDFSESAHYLGLTPQLRGWVDHYREKGYVILEDTGIDDATVTAAISGLAGKYTQSATGYSSPGRLQDAWQTIPAVSQIATSQTILDALRTLYYREPVPFQTLNFERGTQQRAHSDTIHFNSLPLGFMCGVWVALEDADLDNGPLFYYPGSQRLPVFHMHDLGLEASALEYQKYEDRIEKILSESGFKSERALLKRGQALIWSANIFHGGSRVLDPNRTRLSQVTHYYFPGCIYYTPLLSDPMAQRWTLRQVKDIRTGQVQPDYQGLPRAERPKKKRRGLLARIPSLFSVGR